MPKAEASEVHSLGNILPKIHGQIEETVLENLPEEVLAVLSAPETVAIFVAPKSQTSCEQIFDLQALDLKPGQKIVVLPQRLQTSGPLANITLGHNKRSAFWNLKPGESKESYDPAGAYSEVKVFDAKTNSWKGWQDPMGYSAVKYAERRSDIEYENLHDWRATVGDIDAQAVEIRSAGKHPELSVVTEYSLAVNTYPEITEQTEVAEKIFTPGTQFIDLKGPGPKLPKYGGGEKVGSYPQAVPLNGKNGYETFPLTEKVEATDHYLDSSGKMHLRLPVGVRLRSVEVAIGDTWFNYGGSGGRCLGWSKLNVDLRKHDGSSERFMSNVNIPPQGILMGGPKDPDYITKAGDEVILSSSPTSYLMGWRMHYEAAEGKTKPAREKINEVLDPKPAALELVPDESFGSTDNQGGRWYKEKASGERYFVKDYQGNFDRCATEYIVGQIYAQFGIPATQPIILQNKIATKRIPGVRMEASKKHNAAYVKNYFSNADIKSGFVVDAWIANWDVFGLDYDNIITDAKSRMYRMNHGGSLFYRGLGASKPSFANAAVTEVETMRNPKIAKEAGLVFQDIGETEIKKQVQQLVATMTDSVIQEIVLNSKISNPEAVSSALIKRRDWLKAKYL